MYSYDVLFLQTDLHSTVWLWRNSRTQTHPYSTIAPHQSSSYPEYLSPTWDEETQRAVVLMRLREHCKLAYRSLSKINERYKALRQEQQTQVESRHESSSRDTITELDIQIQAQAPPQTGPHSYHHIHPRTPYSGLTMEELESDISRLYVTERRVNAYYTVMTNVSK